MHAKFEQVPRGASSSVFVKQYALSSLKTPLHFHPEWELVWVQRGVGRVFIGEELEHFTQGQLLLIQPNTPHLFVSEVTPNTSEKDILLELTVVHVEASWLEQLSQNLPELDKIKTLLASNQSMTIFTPDNACKYAIRFSRLTQSDRLNKIIQLLALLDVMASETQINYMGQVLSEHLLQKYPLRIKQALTYIHDNYQQQVSLQTASECAAMEKTAFCRSFKQTTRHTFSEYVNQLRLAHACKLLSIDNRTIEQIAFEVGFSSHAYFNRQFQRHMRLSPSKYREQCAKTE